MQQRKNEILAKKAKLAELKKQNELRHREFHASRQSIGNASEVVAPTPGRPDRRELETLIQTLVGDSRPGSTGPRENTSGSQSAAKGSRPNSVLSAGELSIATSDIASPTTGATASGTQSHSPTITLQTLSTAPLSTVYDFPPSPVKQVFTYSKAVQTSEPWSPKSRKSGDVPSDSDDEPESPNLHTPKSSKRLSRRERDREEQLRQNIRKEIEEEVHSLRDSALGGPTYQRQNSAPKFPSRTLTAEELNAVTSSEQFLDFVERSSKVIERALDEEYDVLANYALRGSGDLENEDDQISGTTGKAGRRIKEQVQFYDERWSKKRMISGLSFSPRFPELVLASFTKNPSAPHDPDGLVQVWNQHLHDRPEYIFHAQSDIITAKFSPFHPNLIIGGAYSGQVLLWDTRAKSAPVQKTPLTGTGHTHPVYSIDVIGTQNANNIISCSTDGVVCGWSVDMLAQPQELLELSAPPPSKTEDLSPMCMSFPQSDPTIFMVGTEQGSIYSCHRYDRAGSKAGIENRIAYKGHAAPVMSLDFHPVKGPIDLGDLILSSSLDWSVKLWRTRAPTATSSGSADMVQNVAPILDFSREDVIYDARWSPVKPGIFALVDGSGSLEIWDITIDTEVPVARLQPTARKAAGAFTKSLNKVAWEGQDGKRLAVGGLNGVITVFDVGNDLGGIDNTRQEEWTWVKKTIAKLESTPNLSNGMHKV